MQKGISALLSNEQRCQKRKKNHRPHRCGGTPKHCGSHATARSDPLSPKE